jgi:hypothetical protein
MVELSKALEEDEPIVACTIVCKNIKMNLSTAVSQGLAESLAFVEAG